MKNFNKSLFFFFGLFLAGALVFSSCKNDSTAATDEARESIEESNDAVQPQATTIANSTTNNDLADPNQPLTSIEFGETKYDFGVVEQGEKVQYTFEFTNTGNEPLVLSQVKPSCGCTTPSWTREPIAPGEKGSIDVQFDSAGKSGKQNKTVTVTANTDPAKTVLTITGEINKPADS